MLNNEKTIVLSVLLILYLKLYGNAIDHRITGLYDE